MSELIKPNENKTMSSLEIAKLTGKQHKDVTAGVSNQQPHRKNNE